MLAKAGHRTIHCGQPHPSTQLESPSQRRNAHKVIMLADLPVPRAIRPRSPHAAAPPPPPPTRLATAATLGRRTHHVRADSGPAIKDASNRRARTYGQQGASSIQTRLSPRHSHTPSLPGHCFLSLLNPAGTKNKKAKNKILAGTGVKSALFGEIHRTNITTRLWTHLRNPRSCEEHRATLSKPPSRSRAPWRQSRPAPTDAQWQVSLHTSRRACGVARCASLITVGCHAVLGFWKKSCLPRRRGLPWRLSLRGNRTQPGRRKLPRARSNLK